jgi:hypothetical protein
MELTGTRYLQTNCIIETIQVTEGREYFREGRMLVSPALE